MRIFCFSLGKYRYVFISQEFDDSFVGDEEVRDLLTWFGFPIFSYVSVYSVPVNIQRRYELVPSYNLSDYEFTIRDYVVFKSSVKIVHFQFKNIIPVKGYRLYKIWLQFETGAFADVWVVFGYPSWEFYGSFSKSGDLETFSTALLAKVLLEGRWSDFV